MIKERSIAIPQYRYNRIKENWVKIYTAIVEYGKLQIRYNKNTKSIDLRTSEHTADNTYLERSVNFIQALVEGFRMDDAMSILKYKDVFIETFNVGDVRKMKNSHLQRAIGRIIGRNGKTKEIIENSSRVKFILFEQRIVILGCPENIRIAKDAIGRLIQGSEPNSIFNRLSVISTKLKEKYGCLQTIYEDLRPTEE